MQMTTHSELLNGTRGGDIDIARRKLRRYNRYGARRIGGWFSRVDAELFSLLLLFQRERGISGSNLEIGVHHGKSFIPLCLALGADERAICIDVFDDQDLNFDQSGMGSRQRLDANLARHGVSEASVDIIKTSSFGYPYGDILARAGRVKFASIDGGHWADIVQNDLDLVQNCAAAGQVIALDDIFSVDWSGVTIGFMNWYRSQGSAYSPFAMSAKKLYLCQSDYHKVYKSCVIEDPFVRFNTKKTASVLGYEIPVISGPNRGFRGRVGAYLRKLSPELYTAARLRLPRSV